MFQKVFEYAGPHKQGLYAATAIVLVSVLMGVLPFGLAYHAVSYTHLVILFERLYISYY